MLSSSSSRRRTNPPQEGALVPSSLENAPSAPGATPTIVTTTGSLKGKWLVRRTHSDNTVDSTLSSSCSSSPKTPIRSASRKARRTLSGKSLSSKSLSGRSLVKFLKKKRSSSTSALTLEDDTLNEDSEGKDCEPFSSDEEDSEDEFDDDLSQYSITSGLSLGSSHTDVNKSARSTKNSRAVEDPAVSMSHRAAAATLQFSFEKMVQSQKRVQDSQKIYGRDAELTVLQDKIQSIVSSTTAAASSDSDAKRSLVMVSGPSGAGKSALVNQASTPAKTKGALVVSCSFGVGDATGEPYKGIKSALQQLFGKMRDLVGVEEALLQANMSWEVELISQLIPEIKDLLPDHEKNPTEEGLEAKEATNRCSIKETKSLDSAMKGQLRASLQLGSSMTATTAHLRRRYSLHNIPSTAIIATVTSTATDSNDEEIQASKRATKPSKAAMKASNTGRSAKERLHFALRRFLNVINGLKPLVLVCDDIQFADQASLDMLKAWITDEMNPALLVICTYRTSAVGSDSAVPGSMMEELKTLEQERSIDLKHMHIGELEEADANAMVADIFNMDDAAATEDLTRIIFHKTYGNVFFMKQLLLSLVNQRLISYDMSTAAWRWDIQKIKGESLATDNVVDLMKERLKTSDDGKLILPLAACLGQTFDRRVLKEIILGIQEEASQEHDFALLEVIVMTLGHTFTGGFQDEQLKTLEKEGLIDIVNNDVYDFSHGKIQEAALQLIEKDRLDTFKHYVGQLMLRRVESLAVAGVVKPTFLMVHLLKPRMDLIPDNLKLPARVLFQEAADLAHTAAVYRASAAYYKAAIKLLPENHWSLMYSTTMHLMKRAAEAEMCIGNYKTMQVYADLVVKKSQEDCPILDKIPMYRIMQGARMAKYEQKEMWREGIYVLSVLGFHFSERNVLLRTLKGIAGLQLFKKTHWLPDKLAKLPICTDPRERAISSLFHPIAIACTTVYPAVLPVFILATCKRILQKGLNEYSAIPLAWLVILINSGLEDLDWAEHHIVFIFSLLDRFPNPAIESQVLAVINIGTLHWKLPIHACKKKLWEGYSKGIAQCDIESAYWNAHFHHELALYSGAPLASLQKDVERLCHQERDYGKYKHLDCLTSIHQLILNLQGGDSDDTGLENTFKLTGSVHDEDAALSLSERTKDVHHFVHLAKDRLFAAVIFGNLELAADIGYRCEKTICGVLHGQQAMIVSRFLTGLACFATASKTKGKRKKYIATGRRNLRLLQRWCNKGNPNVQHFVAFLRAEKSFCKGHHETALFRYRQAIALAARSGFNHDHALACERLACLHLAMGDTSIAKDVLNDAINLYEDWGARKKVLLLQEQITSLEQ